MPARYTGELCNVIMRTGRPCARKINHRGKHASLETVEANRKSARERGRNKYVYSTRIPYTREQRLEIKRIKSKEARDGNPDKVREYFQSRRRNSWRQRVIEAYKLEFGCESCGYKEHAVALDLDHREPARKIAALSEMVIRTKKYSDKEFIDELYKCRVLCSNCHRVKTQIEQDLWGPNSKRRSG